MKSIQILLILVLILGCGKTSKNTELKKVQIGTLQGQSLLNKPLISKQIIHQDDKKVKNYKKALTQYTKDSLNAENIIWLGRRIAYLGDYQKAIAMYTRGIELFPKDARFYRHRGHRFISTRQLDRAIDDFKRAVQLVKGKQDVMEPDGIPNRLNQPVSSLHTNIYYHLGLAYYLKHDWAKALEHFQNCYDASNNDDMKVAANHWRYMILKRMEKAEKAEQLLETITAKMNIIENDGYHQLLLFYKGELPEKELMAKGTIGSSEAVRYGVAHWHHYNGNHEKAKALYEDILSTGNWAAFGFIAAEAELAR